MSEPSEENSLFVEIREAFHAADKPISLCRQQKALELAALAIKSDIITKNFLRFFDTQEEFLMELVEAFGNACERDVSSVHTIHYLNRLLIPKHVRTRREVYEEAIRIFGNDLHYDFDNLRKYLGILIDNGETCHHCNKCFRD